MYTDATQNRRKKEDNAEPLPKKKDNAEPTDKYNRGWQAHKIKMV